MKQWILKKSSQIKHQRNYGYRAYLFAEIKRIYIRKNYKSSKCWSSASFQNAKYNWALQKLWKLKNFKSQSAILEGFTFRAHLYMSTENQSLGLFPLRSIEEKIPTLIEIFFPRNKKDLGHLCTFPSIKGPHQRKIYYSIEKYFHNPHFSTKNYPQACQ